MLARIAYVLLAMTAGFYAWARETGFVLRIPLDEAVNARLLAEADPRRVVRTAESAAARDDIAERDMYVAIARRMGLNEPRLAVVTAPHAPTDNERLQRATTEFGAAVISGTGSSEAALTGAMSVANSTAGDIRDILLEGSKASGGAAYDQLILGLSMAGLKSGPNGKPVTLWKVAHRSGLLQPKMSEALMDAVTAAVPFADVKGALAGVNMSDLNAAEGALSPLAAKVQLAPLKDFLDPAAALTANLGDVEAIKVASLAQSPADLRNLAELSAALGPATRGVVELTSIRAISDIKTTTTLEEAVQINPVPVALWSAVLLAMMALGQFQLLGPMPQSRPTAPKRMFRRMPVRSLQSMDGSVDSKS